MKLVCALLFPLTAMASPTLEGPDYACERAVVRGDASAASGECSGSTRAGDPRALAIAKAADEKSRSQASVARVLLDGLAAAETARQAAPNRVVEEAFLQHLARVVRQLIPLEDRPAAAQWPLAGLPVPPPALPPLDDPRLKLIEASIERSHQRIRRTRARLAGHVEGASPLPLYGRAQLRGSLARMDIEHRILVDQRRTTLEEIVTKETKRPPLYTLHLAHAYFFLDAHQPKAHMRRARGMKLLREIRKTHPTDAAAGYATLFVAGFALEDGNLVFARRLLSVAGPFDPTFSSYVNALLSWRAGDHDAALRQIRSTQGPFPPLMTTHLNALDGAVSLEKGDPAAAAVAWQRAMNFGPGEFAERARLNAAIALSEGAVKAGNLGEIPTALVRPTLIYALTQNRLGQAAGLLKLLLGDNGRDLPHLTFMVIDGLRDAGAAQQADRLLALACRRFGSTGPWRSTYKGALTKWVSGELSKRIEERLQEVVVDGVLISPAVRTLVDPLITARLELFPMAENARLELLAGLGKVGFFRRVRGPLLALIENATQPNLRRTAAQALVNASVLYGREAGVKGAKVGSWLDGAPFARPRHPSIDEALTAQGQLIGLLPFRSDERDALVVDRAGLRIATNELGDTVKELEDVANRHLQTRIGLESTYLLLSAQKDRSEELASRYATRRPGPPARIRALERSLDAVFVGRPRTQAHGLLREQKYAEAAARFEVLLESADGDSAVGAALGAAVAWCLGLQPKRAEAAFRNFILRYPSHPQTTVVRLHRARLLHAMGHRAEAAIAYESFARQVGDSPDGAKALLRAIDLYGANPPRLANAVGGFLQRYPDHPAAGHLRVRAAALARQQNQDREKPLTSPKNAGACRGRACQQARFWPR